MTNFLGLGGIVVAVLAAGCLVGDLMVTSSRYSLSFGIPGLSACDACESAGSGSLRGGGSFFLGEGSRFFAAVCFVFEESLPSVPSAVPFPLLPVPLLTLADSFVFLLSLDFPPKTICAHH